jgi:hypothetical protein
VDRPALLGEPRYTVGRIEAAREGEGDDTG